MCVYLCNITISNRGGERERERGKMAELESSNVMPKLISFLSSLLQRAAESNDLNPSLEAQKISVFHGLTRPTISIETYLQRIFKYANCSSSCYIVAYVYLDRFTQRHPALPLNSFNVHRLLITSVMLSAKFMDDMSVLLSPNSRSSILHIQTVLN